MKYQLRFHAIRGIDRFVGFGVNVPDGTVLPDLVNEEEKDWAMSLGCFEIVKEFKEGEKGGKAEEEEKKTKKVRTKKNKGYEDKVV